MPSMELDEFDEEYVAEEPEPFEDYLFESYEKKSQMETQIVKMRPTQFTEFAMRMPDPTTGLYAPFSFRGRKHMQKPYDTGAPRVLLVCARQTEKSSKETSYISMSTGLLRRARDIKVGDRVATLDVGGGGHEMTTGTVVWKSDRYLKPCVRIRTRQGHEVEVATTHPMRIWNGWLDAGNVRVGDRLAIVRECGEFGAHFDIEEARIVLTAYLIGDGHLGKYVSFTSNPGPKLDDFMRHIESVGDAYMVRVRGPRNNHSIRIHLSSRVVRWLLEDGLLGKLSAHKFLPEWVFSLSREQAALFLNRLYATVGSVKKRKSEYSIVYASMSKKLIRDVQAMLWKFGIPTRIRENWPNIFKKRGEKRLAYLLRVETQEGARRFLTEIGALGKSECISLPSSNRCSNRDTYPVEIGELIGRIIASRGDEGRYGPNAVGSLRSARLREKLEYAPSPGKLQRYVDFFRKDSRYSQSLVDLLEKHVSTDLFWDEVEEVAHLGDQVCVDFSVEGTQNFVADGFVTHNSTLLGNKALSYCCVIPSYKVLYVSPSSLQTKTFSSDRLKEPMDTSDVLTAFTTGQLAKNIFEKQFVNRSKITLRYSYLTADRTRGIAAYMLDIDEIQDILYDNIPIIEQCTSHAPELLKRYNYSGTPKSLDNTIEYLRAQQSTQGEWVVPCDAHGGEGGRYWNVLGEKNIGKKSLICESCGKQIDAAHKDAQWAAMVQYRPEKEMFESYRIPQLMVPWKPWSELLYQYESYPRAKFYNEVLGISFDSGLRPLSLSQVREHCKEEISMYPADVEKYAGLSFSQPVFMGLDWGCHDEETRILTDSGFKYFRDLLATDKVAQWAPDTRLMTFVTPLARTVRDWDQPLLHFKSRGGLDLLVTHTHRMRVRSQRGDWVTQPAGEVADAGGGVYFVGHVNWTGADVATFELPGVSSSAGYSGCCPKIFRMDDWLELLGYLITGGRTINPETYQKIQDCLDRTGVPYAAFPNAKTGDVNWTIYRKQYWKWYVENVGDDPSQKRIPRQFLQLSTRQLTILFWALVNGDGNVDRRENRSSGSYCSTSKGLCEDFQELCIRLGMRCSVDLYAPAEGNRQARWRALWSRGRDYYAATPAARVERVPYRGKVYCCTVPSGYIVTERNGRISYQGNSAEHSFTVITLATYVNTKFRVFYMHRCVGKEAEPPTQLQIICDLVRRFNVTLIGADYGGGFHPNDHLVRQFGPQRVQKFQYMARCKRKVEWDSRLLRWKLHRTEVMSDIFNAIKRGVFEFPRWEEFQNPYAQDMCNIFSEYNENLRMLQYMHSPNMPDDALHSLLYCFVISMIKVPRPDVIAPRREEPGRGPLFGNAGYTPLDQGSDVGDYG